MTKFSRPSFSVPGSGSDEHDRIFTPPPASNAARRMGCTCRDATSTSVGCPVHPLDYFPQTKKD